MTDQPIAIPTPRESRLSRWRNSDLWWSFTHKRTAIGAAILLALLVLTAFAAPFITPQNPFDPAQLELWNSEIPPIWTPDGQMPYLLGTDSDPQNYTRQRQVLEQAGCLVPLTNARAAHATGALILRDAALAAR